MLRITQNKSSAGAKKYYSEEYYREGQSKELDYYSEKNQIIGKWGGLGAERLGLGEDISKDDLATLSDNQNPLKNIKLTSRNDSDRTVGYDFTFNASKSVSLAYSFGNDEDKKQILEAFREAVIDAMN
jgi:conjugative relaxase-like TrwC/TraI family protein